MKNLLFAFILLFISSCKDKKTDPVEKKVTAIAITPSSPGVAVGLVQELTATIEPSDAAKKDLTWSSSNDKIAAVDATGKVTGIAEGTAVITALATDGSNVKGTVTVNVTVKSGGSSDVVVSAITLGDENFAVTMSAAGGTATVANAPRTVASDITKVKVNIAAATNAAVKIGDTPFTQGQEVNFSAPVTFTVAAQDGTASKNYTINIPAYDAAANPYGIYTAKHLADVKNGLDKSYLLKNTIDLPNADAADAATATGISDYATAGWLPLGAAAAAFTGAFDGGNFSINNFYLNREIVFAGLFGAVGAGGAIKNLGVNGVINGTAVTGTNRINGDGQSTGILAGSSAGTIDKCYAAGSASSSSISFSHLGGLAGENYGSISNSYAAGSLSASSFAAAYAGGLAGFNDIGKSGSGSISNSYAAGSAVAVAEAAAYAGGLAGYSQSGAISNSYATGSASATTSSFGAYAGGLAGYNQSASISNSYAAGSASASAPAAAYAGGLTGFNDGGTHTNCYRNSDAAIKKKDETVTPDDASIDGIIAKTKAEMQTDAFKGNLNGNSGTAWGRDDAKNDKLPFIIGVGK